jgi:hypothetical protein
MGDDKPPSQGDQNVFKVHASGMGDDNNFRDKYIAGYLCGPLAARWAVVCGVTPIGIQRVFNRDVAGNMD